MRRISRRLFLASSAAAAAALPVIGRGRLDAMQNANPVFRHGVASGDPLSIASCCGRVSRRRETS